MNQPRLKKCPNGTFRNKSSGLCEPKSEADSTIVKRCPNGTYRNRITGLCQSKHDNQVISPKQKSPISSPKSKSLVRRPKCPKGKHRNRITGLCEPKQKSPVSSPKRKSPVSSPKRKSPVSSPKRKSPISSPKRKSPKSSPKRKSQVDSPSMFMSPPMEDDELYRSPIINRSTSIKKSPSNLSVLQNKRFIRDDNYVLTPKLINFYKQNATPIRENIDIHPGTFQFSEIAFKYLSNRYDNLSYPNEDSGENNLSLTFYIIKNPEIYDGRFHISLRNNNQTKEYLIYDFQDGVIFTREELKYLTDDIKKGIAKNKNKRFFSMRVDLQSFDLAHANIIIYDTKKNTLELFDPHGSKTMDKFEPMKVRMMLKIIFEKISPSITFLESYEINPFMGLQKIQGKNEYLRTPDEILGYCGAWTFFYLQMRLANPDLSQMSLIKQIKNEIIKKGNFFNMMRNYVKYIINNGYRHKYNIKPRKLKL